MRHFLFGLYLELCPLHLFIFKDPQMYVDPVKKLAVNRFEIPRDNPCNW